MTEGPPGPPEGVAERLRAGAFLLVDKPRGPSSHQVTAWVRDLLHVERAGHAGTLDPNVSGLLWIGVGPALKLIPLVLDFPKRYVGVLVLHGKVAARELDRVFTEFESAIYQTPPVRSAVKRERRVRTIHRLRKLDTQGLRVAFDVTTDSGTYVRTLAVDAGDALGVGAHLEELRRVSTGPFEERASVTLLTLADAAEAAAEGSPAPLQALLHPITEVWQEFPSLILKPAAASAVAHGANLAGGGILSIPRPFAKGARVVLVTRSGELIATGLALHASDDVAGIRTGWVVDTQRVFADPKDYPPLWREKPTAAPAG